MQGKIVWYNLAIYSDINRKRSPAIGRELRQIAQLSGQWAANYIAKIPGGQVGNDQICHVAIATLRFNNPLSFWM
jgi:hypothetical protein